MTRRQNGLVVNLNQRITMERFLGSRIVADPAAIDALVDAIRFDETQLMMRFAPDEMYVTPPVEDVSVLMAVDEYAIVLNEGAFSGAWVEEHAALHLLEMHAEWEMPKERPAFGQGSVAGVATKLLFMDGKVLFMTPSPYAQELEDRLS